MKARASRISLGVSATLVLAGMLTGCAVPKKVLPSKVLPGWKLEMEVSVVAGANQNSPIAVDLLTVYDKGLVKEVSKMSASDWFDKRVQILRDHPQDAAVQSWEWVPGQDVGKLEVAIGPKADGVFLFANYFTPGPHRIPVLSKKPGILTLREEDFALQVEK